MVVEPAIGLRLWLSGECLNHCMREVWGPEAINLDKMDEEGRFGPTQLVWGLHMNFDSKPSPCQNRNVLKLNTFWPCLSCSLEPEESP